MAGLVRPCILERRDPGSAGDSHYYAGVLFTRSQVAKAIESLLSQDCCRVQRTMPADLSPAPGYLVMNSDPLGIAPEKAEQASWRAPEAYRFNVEPGFVLLATVPAPPERPGGWSMLLMAHDARDGAGTQLLGAWWLGPDAPANPVAAFSQFVARFGTYLAHGPRQGLFYLRSPGTVPPQPAGAANGIELHALPQTRQFAGAIGWAWCFGIDTRKHRTYLRALVGMTRQPRRAGRWVLAPVHHPSRTQNRTSRRMGHLYSRQTCSTRIRRAGRRRSGSGARPDCLPRPHGCSPATPGARSRGYCLAG